MPKIGEVDGIAIRMYYRDHPPPHFHAVDGEHELLMTIADLKVLAGNAPPAMIGRIRRWAASRQAALSLDWVRCQSGMKPEWVE